MKCLSGPRKAREAVKHFGAAGTPHSHAKPFVRYLFSVNDDFLDVSTYLFLQGQGTQVRESQRQEAVQRIQEVECLHLCLYLFVLIV